MPPSPLITVENATLFPALKDWTGGLYTHGVQSQNPLQDPIHFGNVKFGKSLIDKDSRRKILESNHSPKKLSGHHLYMGALSHHFGHLLGECISRFWASEINLDDFESLIFLPSQLNKKSEKTIREILKIFNLDKKIKYIKELTVVEKLTVPEPGKLFGESPKYWYSEFLNRRMNPEQFRRDLPKKIFVSRRNYKLYGRTAGIDYIIKLVREIGFFELLPENYSIQRQLEFICSADEIIWEEGSACHLLEMLPKINSKNILIQRRPKENYGYFIELFKEKCETLEIYSDVEFCKSNKPPHNRMSIIKNPTELLGIISKTTKERLNYSESEFITSEILDILEDSLNENTNKLTDELLTEIKSRARGIISRTAPLENKKKIERHDTIISTNPDEIISWCIDSPSKEISFYEPFSDIPVSGWILINPEKHPKEISIIARNKRNEEIKTSLTNPRPDVIKAIFKSEENHPQEKCGFILEIPFSFGGFNIIAKTEKHETTLSELKLSPEN